jgi:hypothetical protein
LADDEKERSVGGIRCQYILLFWLKRENKKLETDADGHGSAYDPYVT